MSLEDRRIVLGVSGGIAAYKAAELVRALKKRGANVRVVMTAGAQQFITPLTLQTLSDHRVAVDLFDLEQEATVGHIGIADFAELLLIAPATANVISKLATGQADDVLTTVALACKAPLVICPAMNVNMWSHAAVQQNVATLLSRGAIFVGPEAGELACGWVGAGRLITMEEIVEAVERTLSGGDLAGQHLVVTAGGTQEPIDAVRFLGNRSSGKMGFAIAEQAARRGADVTLISGPSALPTPPRVRRVDVATAAEMAAAVEQSYPTASAIVMAAAVADYRPAEVIAGKWKKSEAGDTPSVNLVKNVDILASLGARRGERRHPVLVGFAAETRDVEAEAQRKRAAKRCDLIVGNDVGAAGSGFGTDTNRAVLVTADKAEWTDLVTKHALADQILDAIVPFFAGAST